MTQKKPKIFQDILVGKIYHSVCMKFTMKPSKFSKVEMQPTLVCIIKLPTSWKVSLFLLLKKLILVESKKQTKTFRGNKKNFSCCMFSWYICSQQFHMLGIVGSIHQSLLPQSLSMLSQGSSFKTSLTKRNFISKYRFLMASSFLRFKTSMTFKFWCLI